MDKTIKYMILAACAAMACAGCSKNETVSDAGLIAFYVKSKPHAKAIVEDTDYLLRNPLPIYVTDESTAPAFTNTLVNHLSSGVWRSNVEWTAGRSYQFYAYVRSDGGVDAALDVNLNGKSVTITQPSAYSTTEADYADYLLSYRVEASGADKPLVPINLERITTCVELYMTSANQDVTLNEVSFKNINRSATFSLLYHAANSETSSGGMMNRWAVTVDETRKSDYRYAPDSKTLAKKTEDSDIFDPAYRVVRFLTVQQELDDTNDAWLYVKYTIDDVHTYEKEFDLAKYNVKSWDMGHKVRYYLAVDTEVTLQGVVEEWKHLDFIESTLLPK